MYGTSRSEAASPEAAAATVALTNVLRDVLFMVSDFLCIDVLVFGT